MSCPSFKLSVQWRNVFNSVERLGEQNPSMHVIKVTAGHSTLVSPHPPTSPVRSWSPHHPRHLVERFNPEDASATSRGAEAVIYPIHPEAEHALVRELGRARELRRTIERCKKDRMERPGRTPG